ncbi:hypothetical protein SAMN06295924_1253 [Rathayibacter rathayi NCPPB 2980 = VKM Ac-1601]|nr:hypothetical protein FB469_3138 [Rathayibacter rathayi]SOE06040.1 hypothetical protein SAMN06295924_1253 [Rathayibacter rathayi NCPPB 2980 = VKM Ac-1601]
MPWDTKRVNSSALNASILMNRDATLILRELADEPLSLQALSMRSGVRPDVVSATCAALCRIGAMEMTPDLRASANFMQIRQMIPMAHL